MRRLFLGFLVLGAAGLTATPAFTQKGKGKGGDAARYGWLSSLTEGKAQARKTGKPLMVVLRCEP
jgi:hypothetical protein